VWNRRAGKGRNGKEVRPEERPSGMGEGKGKFKGKTRNRAETDVVSVNFPSHKNCQGEKKGEKKKASDDGLAPHCAESNSRAAMGKRGRLSPKKEKKKKKNRSRPLLP